jgi:transcriptional regulator with XRE-family HTH domain
MAQDIEAMIGRRIRTRRRLLGMTQKDIGQALGVTPQMVHKWETAQGALFAATLYDLAQVLGVTPDYFFDDAEPSPDPSEPGSTPPPPPEG